MFALLNIDVFVQLDSNKNKELRNGFACYMSIVTYCIASLLMST